MPPGVGLGQVDAAPSSRARSDRSRDLTRAAPDGSVPETPDPVSPVPADRGGIFSALGRYPAYRRLWFGSMAASLGQWMQQVGLGWLALSLTDSPAFVGTVGFAAGLPFLVIAIPVGVVIDRFDRRHVLLVCQALAALVALVASVVVITGIVEPWHLLLIAFVTGSLQATMVPTQQSLVPSLVEREDLTNAIGTNSAGQNLTRVVGPSITGIVIGVAGVGAAFVLQAMALLLAFALVWTVTIPARVSRSTSSPKGIFEGVRLIRRRADLRALFLLAAIPTFFIFPYVQFLTVYARDILEIGPGGLGILLACSGTGAVVGSLVVAARRQMTAAGSGRMLAGMTIAYGVVVACFAVSPTVFLSFPLLLLAGMLGAGYMSANNAIIQLRVDDDVRGRVMAAYLLTMGLMPLGALPMGYVAGVAGTPTAVCAGALVASTLIAVLALRSRGLRTL